MARSIPCALVVATALAALAATAPAAGAAADFQAVSGTVDGTRVEILLVPGANAERDGARAFAALGGRMENAIERAIDPNAGADVPFTQIGFDLIWPPAKLPVGISYNPAGERVPSEAAMVGAMQEWTDVPTSKAAIQYLGTTARCPSFFCGRPGDGKNDIGWTTTLPGSALAAATVGTGAEVDIAFNRNFTSWGTGCTPGTDDVGAVALHELGHLLGLGHVQRLGVTMNLFGRGDGQCGLSDADRSGITALYPERFASITGTVRHAGTLTPIAAATVELWNERKAGSGPDGTFAFDPAPRDATYEPYAEGAPGSNLGSQTLAPVTVDGSSASFDFLLDGPTPLVVETSGDVAEGGTAHAIVRLVEPVADEVTVNYGIANVVPIGAEAFGQLTFAPGETEKALDVLAEDDGVYDGDRPWELLLTDPVNASLAQPIGGGTIVEDEPVPTLDIQDVTVDEDAGSLSFDVSLSGEWRDFAQVHFAIGGDAVPNADYTLLGVGTDLASGAGPKTITWPLIDDADFEDTEHITIAATSLGGSSDSGTITIVDDEVADPSPNGPYRIDVPAGYTIPGRALVDRDPARAGTQADVLIFDNGPIQVVTTQASEASGRFTHISHTSPLSTASLYDAVAAGGELAVFAVVDGSDARLEPFATDIFGSLQAQFWPAYAGCFPRPFGTLNTIPVFGQIDVPDSFQRRKLSDIDSARPGKQITIVATHRSRKKAQDITVSDFTTGTVIAKGSGVGRDGFIVGHTLVLFGSPMGSGAMVRWSPAFDSGKTLTQAPFTFPACPV